MRTRANKHNSFAAGKARARRATLQKATTLASELRVGELRRLSQALHAPTQNQTQWMALRDGNQAPPFLKQ